MLSAFVRTWCVLAPGSGDGPMRSPDLGEPVRLEADGKLIDTGKDIGYAGATVHDWDRDGLPDLFVTSIRGNVRYFKNIGSRAAPVFEEQEPPRAGGQPLQFRNW